MNPEWTRKFVELVKSGAPIKAYQKHLGLNKEGLQYHLGRLAEYEASLEPKKVRPACVVKKVAKIDSLIKKVVKDKEQQKDKVKKNEEDKAS